MPWKPPLAVWVALGGLLALAVAVLYMLVGDSARSAPEPEAESGARVVVHPTAERSRDTRSQQPVPNANPSGDAAARPTDYKDYTVGDVRIRDHRSGDAAPIDLPPNIHPPQSRQLPSSLTADIGQQVRRVVRECAKEIPLDVRGPKPQFEAQLTVAIADRKLSILEVVSQVRDVEGPAAGAMRDCVARSASSISAGASEEADIASYGLRFAFIIP